MEHFDYFAPTEIIFGTDRVTEAGAPATRYGKKTMLVTVPEFPAAVELYVRAKKSPADVGVACVHYDGVTLSPTTELVTRGAEPVKVEGVDVVIGLDDGSSIDTIKAIAMEVTHPGIAWDYNCHTVDPAKRMLPTLAINTTAGTSNQTTPCVVITETSAKDKNAIQNRNILPRVAIVDSEVTLPLPANATAQTGSDAFRRNFEVYLSVSTNSLVGCMTLDAIRIITIYLPRALADGSDLGIRNQMAWADTLGGLTDASASVTLPHGPDMQIGGHCPHVTHSQSLAVPYPVFTQYTHPAAEHESATIDRIFEPPLEWGSGAAAAGRSCDAIDCFLKRIGLWINFRKLNVTKEDIREIADCGQALGDYTSNPRVATIPEMYELLMSCYNRK